MFLTYLCKEYDNSLGFNTHTTITREKHGCFKHRICFIFVPYWFINKSVFRRAEQITCKHYYMLGFLPRQCVRMCAYRDGVWGGGVAAGWMGGERPRPNYSPCLYASYPHPPYTRAGGRGIPLPRGRAGLPAHTTPSHVGIPTHIPPVHRRAGGILSPRTGGRADGRAGDIPPHPPRGGRAGGVEASVFNPATSILKLGLILKNLNIVTSILKFYFNIEVAFFNLSASILRLGLNIEAVPQY